MNQNSQMMVQEGPSELLSPLPNKELINVAAAETHTCVRPFQETRPLLTGSTLRRPNRTRPLEVDKPPSGFTTAETYPMQERAALTAGWDDPELDAYDAGDAPQ
jgi:hypothetical protein